jgi:hypothetical protein
MIMKLKSSIPSNSVKLIDLYNKIISNSLILGPDFQRKLVWKKLHKYSFIETILLNFPFPEIYIASDEVDIESLRTKEIVVDGKQRLTAIVDYIQKKGDFINQSRIKNFDDLTIEEKKEFLNYLITVKDLKDIGQENIIEVFKRINSTNYQLNSNEILNAEFGGGEFAIFCKQLADKSYVPSELETSVVIQTERKGKINSFFEINRVFSDNDIKRMFDSQYIMLISSTILEGSYFSRSTKINIYLEKYNDEFSSFNDILEKLTNSISIIEEFKFSEGSYWFNKANLFTLIVEFINLKKDKVDLNSLELKLVDLESKVDVYYNGDEEDIKRLTNDETRYFDLSRQGSHELAAREHRAKVIKDFIENSKIKIEPIADEVLRKNVEILNEKNINYSIIVPTETGLKKNIMDAVSGVRNFLKMEGFNDYDSQVLGPDRKVILDCILNTPEKKIDSKVSLYRSNGRGDYRIWFSNLKEFAESNNKLALINKEGIINVLNLSTIDYTNEFK